MITSSSSSTVLFLFPFTFGVHVFTALAAVPGSQGCTTEYEAADNRTVSSGGTVGTYTDVSGGVYNHAVSLRTSVVV